MNVLQLVQKPQRRGAEIFAQQLSRQLRALGHAVTTAYLYPCDDECGLALDSGDTVLGGFERHAFERIPGVHPLLVWRLRRFIETRQPDVVQVNGGRTLKYGAAAAAAQPGRRWSLVYRNIGQPQDWVRGVRYHFYSHMVMPRVDAVVGVSANGVRAINDLYRLSVPTTCIPCAVDAGAIVNTVERTAIRAETGTPNAAPVIVSVGSLSAEKRFDRLLRAAANVLRAIPDLHVWIIGSGPLRRELEAEARALTLDSRVRFLGVKKNVADYMAAGDVVALTSDTEGMPATVLEAGLLGLPVVATRVGGLSECVLDGETGILVDRNNEDGLANALRDLLLQPERRQQMGRAAHEWVERNFLMSQVARRYSAFYECLRAA